MPRAPSPSLTRHWPALVAGGGRGRWSRRGPTTGIFPALLLEPRRAGVPVAASTSCATAGSPRPTAAIRTCSCRGCPPPGTACSSRQYTLGWPLVLLAADVTHRLAQRRAVRRRGARRARHLRLRLGAHAQPSARPSSPPRSWSARPSWRSRAASTSATSSRWASGCSSAWGCSPGCARAAWGGWSQPAWLLGWIFFTRPYDGAPLGARLRRLRDRRRAAPLARAGPTRSCWSGPAPLPSWCSPRSPTTATSPARSLAFPITEADPLDTFGFGDAAAHARLPDHRLHAGLRALRPRPRTRSSSPGSWPGATWASASRAPGSGGLVDGRAPCSSLLVAVVFPLGYLPVLGHVGVLASSPASAGRSTSCRCTRPSASSWPSPWSSSTAGAPRLTVRRLVIALVLATIPTAVSRFGVNHELSVRQEPWRTSVDAIDGEAIVFVADTKRYLLFLNPFGANGPTARRSPPLRRGPGPGHARPDRRAARSNAVPAGRHRRAGGPRAQGGPGRLRRRPPARARCARGPRAGARRDGGGPGAPRRDHHRAGGRGAFDPAQRASTARPCLRSPSDRRARRPTCRCPIAASYGSRSGTETPRPMPSAPPPPSTAWCSAWPAQTSRCSSRRRATTARSSAITRSGGDG